MYIIAHLGLWSLGTLSQYAVQIYGFMYMNCGMIKGEYVTHLAHVCRSGLNE